MLQNIYKNMKSMQSGKNLKTNGTMLHLFVKLKTLLKRLNIMNLHKLYTFI